MKISVIVITLNEEHYVNKLLDSLVEQTFKDFEVIVVDGNSKDNTCKVVSSYQDRLNIKLCKLDECGISMQRNYRASQATSNHLFFFDADVIVEEKFLEKVVSTISSQKVDYLISELDPLSTNIMDKIIFGFFNIFVVL